VKASTILFLCDNTYFPVRVTFREHGLWFQPLPIWVKGKGKVAILIDALSHVSGEDDEQHAFLTFVKMSWRLQDGAALPQGKVPDPICIFSKNQENFVPQGKSNFGSSIVQPLCQHVD
jgi:hypothetical protein